MTPSGRNLVWELRHRLKRLAALAKLSFARGNRGGAIVLRNSTAGGGLGEPVVAALWEAAAVNARGGASPLQIDTALLHS